MLFPRDTTSQVYKVTADYLAMHIWFKAQSGDKYPTRLGNIRPILHLRDHRLVKSLFAEISSLEDDESVPGRRQRDAYLDVLLWELVRVSGGSDEPLDHYCQLLSARIRSDPFTTITVDEAARDGGMSPSTFKRAFRKETGTTLRQMQIDARLDHAMALLVSRPELTIRQIAARCQFCDEFYFTRCFSRHRGTTPREYRRRFDAVQPWI